MVGILSVNRYLFFYALLFLLFFLPGCFHVPRYKPKNLHELSGRFDATSHHNAITVRVKRMTRRDTKLLFGRRGLWLMHNRRSAFVPLHLWIYNHGACSVMTGPECISMPTVPCKEVCSRMYSQSGMWAFGTLLFGYPVSAVLCFGGLFMIPIGAGIGSSTIINLGWVTMAAGVGLAIATPFWAIGNGVKSYESNTELSYDLEKKMCTPHTIIQPYECKETLVFVRRRFYKPEFTMTFSELDKPKSIITVPLHME
jgi:hypothetical protein